MRRRSPRWYGGSLAPLYIALTMVELRYLHRYHSQSAARRGGVDPVTQTILSP